MPNSKAKTYICEPYGIKSQLIIGCCLATMGKIEDEHIDLIITDPPYNKGKDYLGNFADKKSKTDFENFNHAWIRECFRILKPGHHLYFSCASDQIFYFRDIGIQNGFEFRHLLIWATNECRGHMNSRTWLRSYEPILWFKKPGKTYGLFNNYPFSALDVFIIRSPHTHTVGLDKKVHVCQKPVELFENIMRKSSKERDIVLDPFAGSGTLLVAGIRQKRFTIGIELSEEYEPLISKRVNDEISRIEMENGQGRLTGWLNE